jgi:hypothetical protein
MIYWEKSIKLLNKYYRNYPKQIRLGCGIELIKIIKKFRKEEESYNTILKRFSIILF